MHLLTWNMQGGKYDWIQGIQYLYAKSRNETIFHPDDPYAICCLQEVTVPPTNLKELTEDHSIKEKSAGVKVYKWDLRVKQEIKDTVWIVYYEWTRPTTNKNTRCSLAVVSRAKPQACLALDSVEENTYRPGLAVVFDRLTAVSIHANAAGGNTTQKDCGGLVSGAIEDSLCQRMKPFILAGDFNCPPDKLQEYIKQYDSTIVGSLAYCSSDCPTQQGGKTIDYAVISKSIADRVHFIKSLSKTHGYESQNVNPSDHIPQLFSYSLITVRNIKT